MSRLTLLHIIPIPLRNLHNISPRLLNHGLATQPRIQLNIRRGLHPIQFLILSLADPLRAFLHPDMTGRASTNPTTSMIEKNIKILGHIQKRHGFTMPLIRQRIKRKLHRLALGLKRHSNHSLARRLRQIHFSSILHFTHDQSSVDSPAVASSFTESSTFCASTSVSGVELNTCAFANGCGAVGPASMLSPADAIVLPVMAPASVLSIINSQN